MAKKKSKHTGSRKDSSSPEPDQKVSWKPRSSSVLWLKLNFTIKTARLQKLKRQKYQHLQEEALLKARGLLTNWEDGPVVLTEDLYSHARNENEAQELLNYTPEALALRFSIRSNPDVVDAVKQLWAVELPRDAFGCIDQLGYTALFRRIGRCLEPEADARRRRRMEKTIQEDWIRDSKGESTMGFADFFDSVFELADLWCETIEVDEYIAFLRTLVARVTTMRRHDEGRRLLRPLKQVKAIDDDNLSSSSGEISQSDLDDEEEFAGDDPNGDDSDDDDEDVPVQKEPPSPFLGLVAAKALQSLRLKTQDSNVTSDPLVKDRPRSRERRASAIMVGDLGDLEGIARNSNSETQNTPKTPNALRGYSAKSRVASAKAKPVATALEGIEKLKKAEESGQSNAVASMQRLQSALPRTPVAAEVISRPRTVAPTPKMLNTPMPSQLQQRAPKTYTASFGTSNTGLNAGTVSIDGLPQSALSGARGGLMSSAPRQAKHDGAQSGMFGDFDNTRIGSGGARRTMLSSTPSKANAKADKRSAGVNVDGPKQAKKLSALGGPSSGSAQNPSNSQGTATRIIPAEYADKANQGLQPVISDDKTATEGPREYISGMGFGTPEAMESDNSRSQLKKEIVPIGVTFYTFDEDASPAKRLLPPVSTESDTRGRSATRQGSTDRDDGLDFAGSSKTTAYLSSTVPSQVLATNGLDIGRPASQPLWSQRHGRDPKSQARRSSTKQLPKQMKKIPVDDGYSDVTVSPWDTAFDNDDDDLAKAVPVRDRLQRSSPREAAPSKPNAPVSPVLLANRSTPTLSTPTSTTSTGQPSYCSDVMRLPHEYHDLILGGSSITRHDILTRTESAPVRISSPTAIQVPVSLRQREFVWKTNGVPQFSTTLLEDGVEGRTMTAPAGSPRKILAPLASKRVRRDKDFGDGEDFGLCPRFAEHLESHGEPPAPATSPLFRTDKPKHHRCTSKNVQDGDSCEVVFDHDKEVTHRCNHHHSNNNHQEDPSECVDSHELQQGADVNANPQIDDVTMIVNATRGLVLRPGTMDRYAAKRARDKEHATRSEMMRRRCKYTFAKFS